MIVVHRAVPHGQVQQRNKNARKDREPLQVTASDRAARGASRARAESVDTVCVSKRPRKTTAQRHSRSRFT